MYRTKGKFTSLTLLNNITQLVTGWRIEWYSHM